MDTSRSQHLSDSSCKRGSSHRRRHSMLRAAPCAALMRAVSAHRSIYKQCSSCGRLQTAASGCWLLSHIDTDVLRSSCDGAARICSVGSVCRASLWLPAREAARLASSQGWCARWQRWICIVQACMVAYVVRRPRISDAGSADQPLTRDIASRQWCHLAVVSALECGEKNGRLLEIMRGQNVGSACRAVVWDDI